jgi:Protein of unknown function (DUF3052)
VAGSGYSGTPLAAKLGIREASEVCVLDDPGHAGTLLKPLPAGARVVSQPDDANVVLWFVTERARLADRVNELARVTFPDRSLWVAWPKRASGVPTDVTENVVREVALPLGLVDNKVCAIDETWSGLRLVWRRELRADGAPPVTSREH